MKALARKDGTLIRLVEAGDGQIIGHHRRYGFLSPDSVRAREVINRRLEKRKVLRQENEWLFQVRFQNGRVIPLFGCDAAEKQTGEWEISSGRNVFRLIEREAIAPTIMPLPKGGDSYGREAFVGAVFLAIMISLPLLFQTTTPVSPDEDLKTLSENQKTVVIKKVKVVETPIRKAPEKKVANVAKQETKKDAGAAVRQKLGFLALFGKKELKNAIGGMPTQAERRTAGAGPGGPGGSGGELLTGLGAGQKKITVGNTGIAGMGGVGGKAGAGGGEGGFGKSYVGSGGGGGGRVLSDVNLGEDVELDGGLDKAVIQATIAKYLSQIKACYERGLRKTPGLMGNVTMDFEINAGGRLNFSKVKQTTLGNESVETCISKVMMAWNFPKPVGGTLVRVTYPFMLKPAAAL